MASGAPRPAPKHETGLDARRRTLAGDGRHGHLLHHGQHQLAVTVIQVGGVAADLRKEPHLLLVGAEALAVAALSGRLCKEVAEVASGTSRLSWLAYPAMARYGRSRPGRGRAQQAGALLNVSLGHSLLHSEVADGFTNVHFFVFSRARERGTAEVGGRTALVTIMPTPAQEIFLQNYPLRGEQRTRSTLSSRPWSLPKWTMPPWPRLDGQWSLGIVTPLPGGAKRLASCRRCAPQPGGGRRSHSPHRCQSAAVAPAGPALPRANGTVTQRIRGAPGMASKQCS